MKEIFRLASVLFGGQKDETPVAAGVPETEVYGGLPVSTSVSSNGAAGNRFQLLPEYEEKGKTPFSKHLKFKLSAKQPQAEYMYVSAEMAAEMLNYNQTETGSNRPLSETTADKY